MCPWDFLNEVVRWKHSQQARHASGATLFFFGCVWSAIIEQRLKVAIAESIDAELSSADGVEQGEVWLGPGAKSPDAFAGVSRRSADIAYEFAQWCGGVDGGQGVQVTFIGGLADLSPPVDIGNASAQRPPFGFSDPPGSGGQLLEAWWMETRTAYQLSRCSASRRHQACGSWT